MKTYTLLFTKCSVRSNTQYRAIRGTLVRLNKYYGKNAKTVASLIKAVNKDYDWQYGCTYTVARVELVKDMEMLIGVHIHELAPISVA
jgi:hypothetical protein